MARARRWTVAGLVLLLGAFALGMAGCGDDDTTAPEVEQLEQTGRALADTYMTLLQQKDTRQLRTFLSDAFLVQRADGSTATKEEYLQNLPAIRDYTIPSVLTRQDGSVLTVRWMLVTDETIDGRTYQTEPAPRLSTFVWGGDRWRLASHANFNSPASSATAAAAPASGR